MKNRLDPRALVLSALLVAPVSAAAAQDAGTGNASTPRPVCRARVCPDWGTTERDRVQRRTPPPPTTTAPGTSR